MRIVFFSISAILFMGAIFFGWLAIILANADGMTSEEYARQAQCLVLEQTVSVCDREMKGDKL